MPKLCWQRQYDAAADVASRFIRHRHDKLFRRFFAYPLPRRAGVAAMPPVLRNAHGDGSAGAAADGGCDLKAEYKTTKTVTVSCKDLEPSYTLVRWMPCCKRAADGSDENKDDQIIHFVSESNHDAPPPYVGLQTTEYGYYAVDQTYHYHRINFCPFCGTAVSIEEVALARVVEKDVPYNETRTGTRIERTETIEWRRS